MVEESRVYLHFAPQQVNYDNCSSLISEVQSVVARGVEEIVLLISSPGGFVDPAMMAYNYLKGCPAKLTTHNIGTCESIAVVIFAAGDTRLSVPHGRFLIHDLTWTFPATTTYQVSQLEEILKRLRNDADNIAGILAEACSKNESDIHEAMRNSLTLAPEEALEWGLVHELDQALHPEGATVIRVA